MLLSVCTGVANKQYGLIFKLKLNSFEETDIDLVK